LEVELTANDLATGLMLLGGSLQDFGNILADIVRAPSRPAQKAPSHYPVTPQFAQIAWLRRNAPNLLRDQLIPALMGGGDISLAVLGKLDQTLLPSSSNRKEDLLETAFGKTFLSISKPALQPVQNPPVDRKTWLARFSRPLGMSRRLTPAERFVIDLSRLCDYEPGLPRLEWIRWCCAFLRTYLPLVFLWRTQAVVVVSRAIYKILSGAGQPPTKQQLHDALLGLTDGEEPLLIATDAWINQIDSRVRDYATARIVVNSVLWILTTIDNLSLEGMGAIPTSISDEELLAAATQSSQESFLKLSMPFDASGLECDRFLERVSQSLGTIDDFARRFGCRSAVDFLNRIVDLFPRHTNVDIGWAKNAREYIVYSLRRPPRGGEPDEYALICTWGGGRGQIKQGVRVEPGSGLLAMMVQLAASEAASRSVKPTLAELLQIFTDLRIAFAPGQRGMDMLIQNLTNEGLLEGSPDAMTAIPLGMTYQHLGGNA
jgi:hypothetical protein